MSSNPPFQPPQKKKVRKRALLPWLLGILFWSIFLLWYQYTPGKETIEFFYSCGLYRANTLVFTLLQHTTSYSFAIVLVPACILLLLILWIANWIYIRKKLNKSHFWGIFWLIKWTFILSGFLVVAYLFLWGAGYQRKPIEEKLGLEITKPDEGEIREIAEQVLQIIIENNLPREKRNPQQSIQQISKTMQKIVTEWDEIPIYIPQQVRKTPPGLFLFNSTSGMCFPLTLEPHVDGALPPPAFVATSAHELAHIAGFCGEADASFVGYVSALQSEDPFARYSVALNIYVHLTASLPAEERKKAIELLPPEAQQDLKEEREIASKYRVEWFSKISWRVYDKYLKTQGVKEGVRDYGRATNLLIAGIRKGLIQLPELPQHTPENMNNVKESPPQETSETLEENTTDM